MSAADCVTRDPKIGAVLFQLGGLDSPATDDESQPGGGDGYWHPLSSMNEWNRKYTALALIWGAA